MRQVDQPPGQAHGDHAIFSDLATQLGVQQAHTLGRGTHDWLRATWTDWRARAATQGLGEAHDFDTFWQAGES